MKKLLRVFALVMSVVMLLTASAMAAGTELTISDVMISMSDGDEVMSADFSGLGLNLGFAEKDGGVGMHLGLSAADKSVVDIQACLQGTRLLLAADGISNVYSLDLTGFIDQFAAEMSAASAGMMLTEEDMAALENVGTVAAAAFFMSSELKETSDGLNLTVDMSEESVDSVLSALAAFMDNHPEFYAESGYASFTELIADLGVKFSIRGEMTITTSMDGQIFLIARELNSGDESGIGLVFGFTEDSYDGIDVLGGRIALGTGESAENFSAGAYIDMAYGQQGSEFALIELAISDAYDEEEGVYIALNTPAVSDTDSWDFALQALNGEGGFELSFGENFGNIYLSAEGESISLAYTTDGGKTEYDLNIIADGAAMTASATSTVAEGDGAWMIPADADAINILTLDDSQLSILQMEGMSVLMSALPAMAQANPLIGEMVSMLMGF